MKILAMSGSLRKDSYNTAVLQALGHLAPDGVDVIVYDGMGELPLFNPDRENEQIPAVVKFKRLVNEAEGMVIASPEYAHGISGVMKNALDWLVSGEEFVFMPLMLINTSPRAYHAQQALREVLVTMSGVIVESSCVSVPLLGSNMQAADIVDDQDINTELQCRLKIFIDAVRRRGRRSVHGER